MKLKAIIFAAALFGATFFVTSNSDNSNHNDPIQKQAVERSTIRIPAAG